MANVSCLVRTHDPNSWGIVQGAHVFAHAAANTLFGIHAGLLDDSFFAIAQLDFNRHAINGLVRNGAVLFTDHAISAVNIGDAAGRVEGG